MLLLFTEQLSSVMERQEDAQTAEEQDFHLRPEFLVESTLVKEKQREGREGCMQECRELRNE